jgi:hypothetical protein
VQCTQAKAHPEKRESLGMFKILCQNPKLPRKGADT